MFSSLIQALGVNDTFFIQFLIFLALYPILSRALFYPYFQLNNQRELETRERMKQVDKLKEKQLSLKTKYERKARDIDEQFNKIYSRESKKIQERVLRDRIGNQKELQMENERETKAFLQEIKKTELQMQAEIKQLANITLDRLLS